MRAEAELLLEEERFEEAMPLLEELLDRSPDDRELNSLYGTALLSTGNPSMAIWPLDKAAELPGAGHESLLLLARAHLDIGSPSDAVEVIDRVLDERPDILEALELRIEAYRALGQSDSALEDVDYILSFRPQEYSALLARASLLLDLERAEDAEAAIAKARSTMETEDAPEEWKARFCAIDATFIFERQEEGYAEHATGTWEECLEDFPADPLIVTQSVDFFDAQGKAERSMQILRAAVGKAPENSSLRVALGLRLAARGEHEEAEDQLFEAVALPNGASARSVLIEYFSERLEYDKALAVLEEWIELMIEPPTNILILHPDLLIRAGKLDAAEDAIDSIEQPEFKSLMRGRLELARGNPERAIELLEAGIQLWPGNAVARILAAEAAEQLGDFDRAIAEYTEAVRNDASNWEALSKLAAKQEALRRPQPITQFVNRYVETQPRDSRGHRLRFEIGMWSDNDEAARGAIRTLAAMPDQRATAVAFAGRFRAKTSRIAAVRFIAESPIDLTDPENAEALTVLLENLGALDQHDAAIERVDAALSAHPDAAVFHELRANALGAAGRPTELIHASLIRALELEPDRPGALLTLGRLESARGSLESALSLFDRAAEADPDEPAPQWAAVLSLLNAEREADVEARLRKLLSTHSEHRPAVELLARRLSTSDKDLGEAQLLAERAVRLGGGADALVTLGRIYHLQGNTQRALRVLRRSVNAQPNSPSARYQLGVALAKSGDVEAARAELSKALETESFPEAEAAREELSRLGGPTSG